ncbi:MAG: hypothetical protein HC886_06500 [Leptolyngbyaceae cyanobacterium SM1_1_3]|nr:hypothetical protein [Leptolyngbyaceae cyanobacterium SM1_1_3]NJN01661.1 hypothetical protein [Leptolyngbyaceae cyanobacterium RM1_1_2]NJO11587.1 hypothetical protein [Leptolyngbyaceae cyanobacterium SL_1_1]
MLAQSVKPAPVDDLRAEQNAYVKQIGIAYWMKLVREGVPKSDARTIAAAIAKYDVAKRPPSSEQKALIVHYSPLICRAQLWRTSLLLD